MVSPTARVPFRIGIVVFLLVVAFYVGRPLYWKLSATAHEIRANKTTVREGISQFVFAAKKSVGWFHEDLGFGDGEYRNGKKAGVDASRKLLLLR